MTKDTEIENSDIGENVDETKIPKPVKWDLPYSLKINMEMLHLIQLTAAFERKKPATHVRDILVEKIKVYQRNPAFKRFLKTLGKEAHEL